MLDGVKTQYDLNFSLKNLPRAVPPVATDLHCIFSFCSIPLKICHRLRGLWGQGTDRSSAPSRFARIFFLDRDYCPPERTGKYPSRGTLGSSWNLEFLNLT